MKNFYAKPESKFRAAWRSIRRSKMATLDPFSPSAVKNMNVVGIVEMMDAAVYEIMNSGSASLTSIELADYERIVAAAAKISNYAAVIYDGNTLDLPHSNDPAYTIEYSTEGMDFGDMKNHGLRDIIRLYVNGWVDWSRSASADRPSNYYPADYNRFVNLMDSINNMLSAYDAGGVPQDAPAHSSYEMAKSDSGA
jgi:hypothetical protein